MHWPTVYRAGFAILASMLPRLLAAAVVLLVLTPGVAAFSAVQGQVDIRYDVASSPLLLASGKLDATGDLKDGLLSVQMVESRIGPIPTLSIAETHNGSLPTLTNVSNVTLVVHAGHLVWKLENASAALHATTGYGFGLALGQSPFDANNERSPALVLAGPAIEANIRWTAGGLTWLPLNATISVLDANGKAVPDWDHRTVNPSADLRSADNGPPSGGVLLNANGAFNATLHAQGIAAGLSRTTSKMQLTVAQSGEDRFLDAADAVANATKLFSQGQNGGGGGGDGPFGGGGGGARDALQQLGALSGVFNGAVLILKEPSDSNKGNGTSNATTASQAGPISATLGGQALDLGPFALLRSQSLALAWGDGTVSVQGAAKTTVTQSGFAVNAPLTVGLFPVVSIVLWLIALGSIVIFFVKRPPASKGKWSLRGLSWVAYAIVFLVVFWFWDRSFADTFGTSVITQLRAHGFSASSYTQLALVFGIEMIPWSLAALLFALPIRIALGVALRYRGQGSSFKGVAKAGGLVALGVLGPLYALWIVNVMLAQVVQYAPKLFGGG